MLEILQLQEVLQIKYVTPLDLIMGHSLEEEL